MMLSSANVRLRPCRLRPRRLRPRRLRPRRLRPRRLRPCRLRPCRLPISNLLEAQQDATAGLEPQPLITTHLTTYPERRATCT